MQRLKKIFLSVFTLFMLVSCMNQKPVEQKNYNNIENTINLENNLNGKSILFCGDSITEAICERYNADTSAKAGWPGRIGINNNMHYVNAGVSGATISLENIWNPPSSQLEGRNIIYNQLRRNSSEHFDLVIMHGGVNDAWANAPVGQITALDNFNPDTFNIRTYAGGLEYTFWTAKQLHESSKFGFIINFRMPSKDVGRTSDMTEYFDQAKKICEKWEIPYLDLYSNDELSQRLKVDTLFALGDYCHPNNRGYDILYPYIEQFVIAVDNGVDPRLLKDPVYTPIEFNTTILPTDKNVAYGKSVFSSSGRLINNITDGSFQSGEDVGVVSTGQGYGILDLGSVYDINKISVCCGSGNIEFSWQVYASIDNNPDFSQWSLIASKDNYDMEYPEGYLVGIETISARYILVFGTYSRGANFHINEIGVYGTINEGLTFAGVEIEQVNIKSVLMPDGVTRTNKIFDGNKTSDPLKIDFVEGGVGYIDLQKQYDLSKIECYLTSNNMAYSIFASNDETNWVRVGKKELNDLDHVDSVYNLWLSTFLVNGSYRYIKFRWDDSGIGSFMVEVKELKVFDINNQQITDYTYRTYLANYPNDWADNRIDTAAHFKQPENGVIIDLGREKVIRKMSFFVPLYTSIFRVLTSNDGVKWQAYGANVADEYYNPEVGYNLYGSASARYINFIPKSYVNEIFELYEVEIFAEKEEFETEKITNAVVTLPDGVTTTDKLFDGDKTNDLLSLNYIEGGHIIIDLNGEYSLSKINCYTNENNSSYTLFGSNDKENWQKIGIKEKDISDSHQNQGWLKTFEIEGSYRYLKVLYGTSVNKSSINLSYIEIFDNNNEKITGHKLDSFSNVGYPNDCIHPSGHSQIKAPDTKDLVIDLLEEFTIREIRVYLESSEQLFTIMASNDQKTWTTIDSSFVDDFYNPAEGYLIYANVKARYIRLVPQVYINEVFNLYEIEVLVEK